ncbi:RNA polymerase subunit sigma-70 [Pediococcus acidilactici]|uniref:RNA polymerase subunit sigma-70 n=1 Tax=Pediococcus acidilactici TaxID=1254 RepID=UPI000BEF0B8C|nr:RNA polymerase subunit sigma-70 [Pediococcus acidilactici]MCQ0050370.1 RNA polymerase subunit sigma-70 [Pediococcus acidilactici]MCQ0052545.1 RNA polymerase subunit sigma-70 [Pediococcus acidilactici]MCQ0054263.1 RNA polymerase subunit sigma-70 [Pediococcus acidilactici]MCQ0061709.1 RNA polymerase subunit sigma-70 [Pediococcus acidilactici]MCQ0068797.1 RNA polymerase subunit sigma-70 [Pediococcus acidilactici]
MWQLVGVNSKEVYGKSKHKSDLHKWMIKTYTKYDGDRKDSIYMDMPEPMRYVRVGTAVKQSDIEQELLDRGDYEGFRKARGLSISKIKKRKYIGEISMTKHKMKVARQSLLPEMLDRNLSYADIAWKLGVEVQTIYSDLRELGIEIKKGNNKRTPKKWTKKEDAFLIAERNKGAKFDEIAEKLGMTGYNVASHWYKVCKKKVSASDQVSD